MKFIADLHTHTCASTHAFCTITENAQAANAAGMRYIAMTDHGVKMPDAPHIWHFYSMDNIPRVLHNVTILRGIEANIMDYDGNIDIFEEDLYAKLDFIVVSYHHPCCLPKDKRSHTNSYLKVLENPNVDCIGHSETPDFVFDIDAVCKKAAKLGKIIELNAARIQGVEARESYKPIMEGCMRNHTMIAVNSDAHFYNKIGQFKDAEKYLNSLNFPEELVLNADTKRFESYLNARAERLSRVSVAYK